MDELIHVEVLGRKGEVSARYSLSRVPIRIGRAYDNDVILDDPYAAAHHVVVEQSATAGLELADMGSRNGLFRAGCRRRIVREQIDPDARYRAGRTEFRIRRQCHSVPAELPDHPGRAALPALGALTAVIGAALMMLVSDWSETFEPVSAAKLASTAVLLAIGLFIWSGAWSVAGRVLAGERRFAAHLQAAAVAVVACFVVAQWDYLAFAMSAPQLRHLAIPGFGGIATWCLWKHLSMATGGRGWRLAVYAGLVAATGLGAIALLTQADREEELATMRYLKAVKPPAVRMVAGLDTKEFFQAAADLRSELEALKTE